MFCPETPQGTSASCVLCYLITASQIRSGGDHINAVVLHGMQAYTANYVLEPTALGGMSFFHCYGVAERKGSADFRQVKLKCST